MYLCLYPPFRVGDSIDRRPVWNDTDTVVTVEGIQFRERKVRRSVDVVRLFIEVLIVGSFGGSIILALRWAEKDL